MTWRVELMEKRGFAVGFCVVRGFKPLRATAARFYFEAHRDDDFVARARDHAHADAAYRNALDGLIVTGAREILYHPDQLQSSTYAAALETARKAHEELFRHAQ